jgi:hypothetical protein
MLEGARLGRLRNKAQEARSLQIRDFSQYQAIHEKNKIPGGTCAWDNPAQLTNCFGTPPKATLIGQILHLKSIMKARRIR